MNYMDKARELKPILEALEALRQANTLNEKDILMTALKIKCIQFGEYKALAGIMSEAELVITSDELRQEYQRQYDNAFVSYYGVKQ